MKRYCLHKLAQLTVFLLICLAPVLFCIWFIAKFLFKITERLVILNAETISKIINHESRYV